MFAREYNGNCTSINAARRRTYGQLRQIATAANVAMRARLRIVRYLPTSICTLCLTIAASTSPAEAHHDAQGFSPFSPGGVSPLRIDSRRGPAKYHQIEVTARYLSAERKNIGDDSLSHYLQLEPSASYSATDSLAISMRLPLVAHFQAQEADSFGLGDIGVGLLWSARGVSDGRLNLSTEVYSPSGDQAKGHGAGYFWSVLNLGYNQPLGARVQLGAQAGVSWGFNSAANAALDYGGSIAVQLSRMIWSALELRARTFLRTTRDSTSPLSILTGSGRRAGDTGLLLAPNARARLTERLDCGIDVQIPVGRVRNFELATSLSIRYLIGS